MEALPVQSRHQLLGAADALPSPEGLTGCGACGPIWRGLAPRIRGACLLAHHLQLPHPISPALGGKPAQAPGAGPKREGKQGICVIVHVIFIF